MTAWIVDIGMAAGTIRLIRRERPGDDLIVGSVTVNTKHRRPMVTRVVGRVMSEPYQWYPLCRGVTAFTVQCGDKMCCAFTGCCRAIVTTQAQAGNIGMVKSGALPPRRVMATAAFRRCLQMGCVFSGCGHAVVTTAAGADRAAVIESGAGPCGGVVATTALGCGR